MPDVDPEKILKELDAQLTLMRASRGRPLEERNAVRIKVLVVFCVLLMMALWVLQALLSQMFPARKPAPSTRRGRAGWETVNWGGGLLQRSRRPRRMKNFEFHPVPPSPRGSFLRIGVFCGSHHHFFTDRHSACFTCSDGKISNPSSRCRFRKIRDQSGPTFQAWNGPVSSQWLCHSQA